VPPELERPLLLAGLDPGNPDRADRSLVRAVEAAQRAGFPMEALLPAAQAYARGLGRIVGAEADNFRRMLRTVPPEEQAEQLDRVLGETLPPVHTMFEALHVAMLREALRDALSVESLAEPDQPDRVVALVDICDSTRYLATADRPATREMVDALYEAGRTAQLGRAVWTVKYVGDGVFLVGRGVREVTDAALEAVSSIAGSLPLQARAGVARGPVVRRAGDYFGPVVNLAQRLTTVAPPQTAVVAEPAAEDLDPATISDRDEVELRGIEGAVSVAIVPAN
jgi:adenylate cyclase